MLDTRIEGRDRQYNDFGNADGGINRYLKGLVPINGVLQDASCRMISTEQQNWLTTGLTASTAAWQFVENQDIMARMWLSGFGAAKAGCGVCHPADGHAGRCVRGHQ